jgi:serine/tyrosine/threonine adenylyltransferase
VCNHSDHQGRYAFANQPGVAYWNLHALAQALLPLAGGDVDAVRAALAPYEGEFGAAIQQRLRAKLGLRDNRDGDAQLVDELLKLMSAAQADYTITMRRLCDFDSAPAALNAPLRDLFIDRAAFDAWAARYRARLAQECSDDAERAARMRRVNPKFVLRNYLAEEAIRAARAGDFGPTQRLQQVLEHPYDEQPGHEALAGFAPDWARQLEVSCSS